MTFFFIKVLALESCFYYGERFSLWGLLGQGKAVEGIRVANEEGLRQVKARRKDASYLRQ